jgi:hypothetical protein
VQSCTLLIPETHKKKLCKDFDPCNKPVPFSRFILHRAGRLEQLDHSRNPFRVLFFLSGRSPGTITPLAKPFSRFILQRAGRLKQLDHSRNSLRSFIIGQVAQNNLIHFKKQQKQKQKQKNKKKWVIVQMTCS